jgi:hypothetical protein
VYDTDPFGPIDRVLATLPRSPGATEPWDPVLAVAAAAAERADAADGKDATFGAATDHVEH